MDIKRIVNKYKQLYAHKSNKLDEMDQFLERHGLSKPTHERINNKHTYLLHKLNQEFITFQHRNYQTK